jgi:hypothetical protein
MVMKYISGQTLDTLIRQVGEVVQPQIFLARRLCFCGFSIECWTPEEVSMTRTHLRQGMNAALSSS